MSDSHQIPITDEMIALAWNEMRPSHRLRGIEAHEAAEMKAAISAALAAAPSMAVSDDRDAFEFAYVAHAIEYVGLDDSQHEVQQRLKDGRDGDRYKHIHDSGAWVGWKLARAALAATPENDELDESREDLFWKLHSLSKSLESRGLIDQHDQPEAYAAILDAMKLVRQGAAAAPVVLPEPVAFALEWTFDGEERGIRLYDDERHCRLDAESDGGVCSPLYTEQQVRALLAQAAIAAAPAHHAEGAQTDLHAAIMNIPVNKAKLEHLGINERLQYKIGHRDARHDAAELAVAHAPPQAQADARDAELLGFLQDQCIDLRCFTTSDGEDVGWRTVQHHMGEPRERLVSEVYSDDPRRAIREAMARIERDPYCTGPLHLEDDAAIAAAKGEGQ